MAQKQRARRASKWRKLSAATAIRCLGAGLLVLAFLFQNYVAERHFHAISAQAAGIAQARASVDVLTKPFVPTSDQHDDDCPLCQVLGLGATTDVPQGILIVVPQHTVDRMHASDAKPLGTFHARHYQPRAPPVLFSI